MVIGNGMIANRFMDYKKNPNFIIFASGVSRSQEIKKTEFAREEELLLKTITEHPEKTFIYFSTCSIYDFDARNSPYVKHKLAMEQLIQIYAKNFYIFRVSQIVGNSHNETLINFLFNKIKNQEPVKIRVNCTRNLIDVDDLYQIIDYILQNSLLINNVINISNSISLSIREIVSIIENCIGSRGIYDYLNTGSAYPDFDIHPIKDVLAKLNILFNKEYYQKVIMKYYQNKG